MNQLSISGDPGHHNLFEETKIHHAENVNPNLKTLIQYINPPTISPRPMILTKIINKLADCDEEKEAVTEFDTALFYIPSKIRLNDLKRWEEEIKCYTPYSADLQRIYDEFDKQGKNKRVRVMRFLHSEYRRLADSFHGDELFDHLKDLMVSKVSQDHTLNEDMEQEVLEDNVKIVLVDAFINCEIFEKPKEEPC